MDETHSPADSSADSGRPGGAKGRLPELDVLRAIAVIAVLGSHFPFLGRLEDLRGEISAPVWHALAIWQRAGWIGVDLFFVLSGFLVSGLLFQEQIRFGAIDGKRFFLRRGLKIYPAFYVFLFVTAAMQLLLAAPLPPVVFWVRFIGELFFLQNYYGSLWSHTWTLAVEEHFYLMLLGLALFLARIRRHTPDPFRDIPRIFPPLAVLLLGLRTYLIYGLGYDATLRSPERVLAWTHTRVDSLYFGVVLSYFWHFHAPALRRFTAKTWMALPVVTALAIAPAMRTERVGHPFISTFGFTLQYLGFGALLLAMLEWGRRARETERRPSNRALALIAYVGQHSYSIYLWHMVVAVYGFHFLRLWTGRTQLATFEIPLYLIGSIVLGVGMSLVVEQPVLRLRDRWIPSRTASSAPSPVSASP